ncbi:MurR/RpiR family transcriptional regulator [Actinomadura luteofluorescens]|uniref:MurR/RpiR family transcriptional regulator n=1 Tax=Actinomadura luteofluorescens TaxID=46163 RepID=UPI003636AAAE
MTESEPGRTLAERLRALVGTLPPAEQKVARTLLAGYPTVALEPVAALARRATVSAPTVLRLAQRLGFAGYADLQTALKIELQDRLTSPLTQYDTSFDEAPGPRSRDMFSRGIRETFSQLPDGELERAAALLADGRRPRGPSGDTSARFSRAIWSCTCGSCARAPPTSPAASTSTPNI